MARSRVPAGSGLRGLAAGRGAGGTKRCVAGRGAQWPPLCSCCLPGRALRPVCRGNGVAAPCTQGCPLAGERASWCQALTDVGGQVDELVRTSDGARVQLQEGDVVVHCLQAIRKCKVGNVASCRTARTGQRWLLQLPIYDPGHAGPQTARQVCTTQPMLLGDPSRGRHCVARPSNALALSTNRTGYHSRCTTMRFTAVKVSAVTALKSRMPMATACCTALRTTPCLLTTHCTGGGG